MSYTYSRPLSVSFTGKGLLGYTFGPLKQEDLEIYYIESEKGHDMFMVSKKITRLYYVLAGNGHFTIDDRKYEVTPGMLVEVPPKVEYCYSGKMTMLAVSRPRNFRGNDAFTKWNPDVVGYTSESAIDAGSLLTRLVRARLFGRSLAGAFLWLNARVWAKLPSPLKRLSITRCYGRFLHTLARRRGVREQAFSTLFLRNRPQLEMIRRLVQNRPAGSPLRVAVFGCSTGPEAYSVAWAIRSARPDLKLTLQAVDISRQAVEIAEGGVYSLAGPKLGDAPTFERMTAEEMKQFFDLSGDTAAVKPWIKENIRWHVGDAGAPDTIDALGSQDIVVANNFLCHMEPVEAEQCLRNIARALDRAGYLFVSGVDLDVRAKVARELGWKPVQELLDDIHEGDPCMRDFWPFHYGGLEPLNKKREDWRLRYAAVFESASVAEAASVQHARDLHEDWARSNSIAPSAG